MAAKSNEMRIITEVELMDSRFPVGDLNVILNEIPSEGDFILHPLATYNEKKVWFRVDGIVSSKEVGERYRKARPRMNATDYYIIANVTVATNEDQDVCNEMYSQRLIAMQEAA